MQWNAEQMVRQKGAYHPVVRPAKIQAVDAVGVVLALAAVHLAHQPASLQVDGGQWPVDAIQPGDQLDPGRDAQRVVTDSEVLERLVRCMRARVPSRPQCASLACIYVPGTSLRQTPTQTLT